MTVCDRFQRIVQLDRWPARRCRESAKGVAYAHSFPLCLQRGLIGCQEESRQIRSLDLIVISILFFAVPAQCVVLALDGRRVAEYVAHVSDARDARSVNCSRFLRSSPAVRLFAPVWAPESRSQWRNTCRETSPAVRSTWT